MTIAPPRPLAPQSIRKPFPRSPELEVHREAVKPVENVDMHCTARQRAGKQKNGESRRKKYQHCEEILAQLWDPSEALNLFEKAYQAIEVHTTQIDRDRLRSQAFTSEYLSKL